MKRLTILCFLLVLFTFSGCGTERPPQVTEAPPTVQNEDAKEDNNASHSSAEANKSTVDVPNEKQTESTPEPTTPPETEDPPVTPTVPQAMPENVPASAPGEPVQAMVHVHILDDTTGEIFLETSLLWVDGLSAWDVLEQAAADAGLPLEYHGVGNMIYVVGIGDLYEFDRGAMSGWLYEVNGRQPNVSSGAYTLQPGDHIRWVYRDRL